jgi:hypothetical protein
VSAFHLMAYGVTAGVNDANVDMTAVPDVIFTARNNHFIFSEPYELIAAMHMGASALRVRSNWPSLNNYGRHQLWPVNRAAVPPSFPRIDDYRGRPLKLPTNEEVAFEESGNLGAATELETLSLWIAEPGRNYNLPQGTARLTVRATAAVARTAFTWSGGGVITLSDNLVGGWYALCGAYCFDVNCRMFRFIFPQYQSGQRRNYRPGSYCTNAIGNLETPTGTDFFNESLGVWGVFNTFELPQLEVFGDVAGASTQELRLNLVYLGGGGQLSIPSIG